MVEQFNFLENETADEALYRIGKLKYDRQINVTWEDISEAMDDYFDLPYGESYYRKKWKKIFNALNCNIAPLMDIDKTVRDKIIELEKKKVQIRAENNAYRKQLRDEALDDEILNRLTEHIKTITPEKNHYQEEAPSSSKAIYALLSDVHYGIEFKSRNGDYSPEIARERIAYYAYRIVSIGREQHSDMCYVSLIGDLISGMIHSSLRIENAQNVVKQVMEVSESIAKFLAYLGDNFKTVKINNVSGNHSRVEPDVKNAPRGERLDDLILWYCKSALKEYENIEFEDNKIDPTIALFNIFDYNYVIVHGDFDKNMKQSVCNIQELINTKIDYFIYGHLHVPNMRFENVGYIGNGAVISGGDDYTIKKRLFGPAMQIVMTVTENGVESLYPVRL